MQVFVHTKVGPAPTIHTRTRTRAPQRTAYDSSTPQRYCQNHSYEHLLAQAVAGLRENPESHPFSRTHTNRDLLQKTYEFDHPHHLAPTDTETSASSVPPSIDLPVCIALRAFSSGSARQLSIHEQRHSIRSPSRGLCKIESREHSRTTRTGDASDIAVAVVQQDALNSGLGTLVQRRNENFQQSPRPEFHYLPPAEREVRRRRRRHRTLNTREEGRSAKETRCIKRRYPA